MDGYKVFNPDWTSSNGDTVYEVGRTYRTAGKPELCRTGLHFCENLIDCFNYYAFDFRNHVCRVRALGEIDANDDAFGDTKACTNELAILEEIPWGEVFEILESSYPGYAMHCFINRSGSAPNCGNGNGGEWNAGYRNDGSHNSGNGNSGHGNAGNGNGGGSNAGDGNRGEGNAGDGNDGNCNAGSWNRGSRNAGDANGGSRNAGNWNRGSFNVGSHNEGSSNIGDWNAGFGNRGCFCTGSHEQILMFDGACDWTMSDWLRSRARRLLGELSRRYREDTGSAAIYAADASYREYAQRWWCGLSGTEVSSILLLPNFDPEKFLQITGIDVYKSIDEEGGIPGSRAHRSRQKRT